MYSDSLQGANKVKQPDPFFGFNHKQVFNEAAERRYSDGNEQRELVGSLV